MPKYLSRNAAQYIQDKVFIDLMKLPAAERTPKKAWNLTLHWETELEAVDWDNLSHTARCDAEDALSLVATEALCDAEEQTDHA